MIPVADGIESIDDPRIVHRFAITGYTSWSMFVCMIGTDEDTRIVWTPYFLSEWRGRQVDEMVEQFKAEVELI